MPREKKLESYPKAFSKLFLKGADAQVEIECEDAREARNLRFELYTFRRVLRKECKNLKLLLAAENIRMEVRDNVLIVRPAIPRLLDRVTVSIRSVVDAATAKKEAMKTLEAAKEKTS